MSLTKRIGFGVVLECDPTGGTTFAAIGSVVDGIDGAEAKTDEVDTALLTEKFKTKSGAQVDPGNVTYQIAYDPADSTTTILTGLLESSAAANWQISYPIIGAEMQQKDPAFLGFVSGFKVTRQKTKMVLADVTITISGKPGLAGIT